MELTRFLMIRLALIVQDGVRQNALLVAALVRSKEMIDILREIVVFYLICFLE